MAVWPALHIGIAIERPLDAVYAFLSAPENFPQWASGLGHSLQALGGGDWRAETPLGPMRIRFSEPNPHGVLDHTLFPASGPAMTNPMRAVANGDGSEVSFTLFRRPGMSEAELARDADWVRRDLAALKALLESGQAGGGD